MPLTPGTRIGTFEIIDMLGEGGMGEVYRARDTKLDREVALKVLPTLFVSDVDRLARFEREARLLASLNHPNIAQVYDFERPAAGAVGQAAIAMELVDGGTLADVIAEAGALPLDRALAILRQIAAALDAAHDRGIIHRDLKPANVKVREDGTVKVLDFGLAKAFAADAESANADPAQSPTLTARSTQLGMIIGTAAYMSPEQAKGRPVDRRADVWAFGVVFFEMLAGRRPFDGDDVSDLLASVLKTEPDWTLLPPDLPPPVGRLLRRCLEKDPKKRLRDVSEGMLQLDEGLASASTTSVAGGRHSPHVALRTPLWRRVLPFVGVAAATALIVLGITAWRAAAASPPVPARFVHIPPVGSGVFSTQAHRDLAISPDGRAIVFVTGLGGQRSSVMTAQLQIRAIDRLESVPVRGAEPAISPFFSPDGEWIGFVDQGDHLSVSKVAVLGGPAVHLTKAAAQVLGASWASDGVIILGSRQGPLLGLPDGGGETTPLTALRAGETSHVFPSAIPGTSVVLFVAVSDGVGGPITSEIAAVDRSTGRTERLRIEGLHPQYAATGHIIYATADGALRAVAFDPTRLVVQGNPAPALEGVGVKPSGAANFDLSANGHLVYTGAGSEVEARTLAWVDRSGKETPIAAPARNYYYARISPDGTKLSLDARDEEEDIWIWDVRRETLVRLTDQAGTDQYGLWTPDNGIVFSSFGGTNRVELYRHRPDGVGRPERLTDTAAERLTPYPNAVTPDGKHVIFRSSVGSTQNDLFIVDMTGDKKVRPLLSSEHDERNAAMSPDGRSMLFESDMSGGGFEVYIRQFPDVAGEQLKVSINGGTEPVWSPQGREIFYVADNKLMSVQVTRGSGLQLSRPVALFDVTPYFFGGTGRNYDVSPDGKRFVMVKRPASQFAASRPIGIVLNWVEELRARMKSPGR